MPEMPEVETIRKGLKSVIVGKKIIKFESFDPKVVRFKPEDVEGKTIQNIDRKAKILIFELSCDKVILTHLKMTGQLIWEEESRKEYSLKKIQTKSARVAGGHPSPDWVSKLPTKHTRAIFHFDDNSTLFFNDLRRFAYMKLYDKSELSNLTELKNLGPEVSSPDFDVMYLMRRAAKVPNRKVKQFITDQTIISGVGNIYVDEALFYAGISPLRPVKEILKTEWEKIHSSIIKALELGLKYNGSSEDTYVDAFGNPGEMDKHTMVYRKTGQKCPGHCGGTIHRTTLGGRGTHYCPACQK